MSAIVDRIVPRHALTLALLVALSTPTPAQSADPVTLEQLRQELQALKAEQAERDRAIRRIEEALDRLQGDVAPHGELEPEPAPAQAATTPAAAPTLASATADTAPRLKISGDARVRAQGDWSDDDGKNRLSMQFRGRLGATWAATDRLTVGARLATGDADDPNSVDVQLSNWLDDLDISLDQAYLRYDIGHAELYAGKMPQPFKRTELVWDGDVNPQGLAIRHGLPLAGGGTLRSNALYFVVDESAGGPDSEMAGLQLGYDSPRGGDWRFDAALAYYHYDLGSLAGADAGDFRSNLRGADGRYLSDFHLANALLGVDYHGFGERWPLRLVADYVKNLGAWNDADSGYGVDLILGKAAQPGDWRFTYGYAMTQADAVLAAFSQDSIGIGTNYRLHALSADFVPWPKTTLSAVWYHYRPYEAAWAGANAPRDWLDRLRLSLMVSF